MRFKDIDLTAFGSFTGRSVDLSRGHHGIHILFGPNEAGKSVALRAFYALLFGIPDRTTDDFVHPKNQLKLGGTLCNPDGSELSFVRLKKRKDSLRTTKGDVLDDSKLAPFIGQVSPELFTTLFGIDHKELVSGGAAILEQKGHVGKALFSAATGSLALQDLLSDLESTADGLFKPSASSKKINEALSQLKSIKKEIKDVTLAVGNWDELQKKIAETEKELCSSGEKLVLITRELSKTERIKRILPILAERRDILLKIKQLGDVVLLPEDFGDRLRGVQDEFRHNRESLGKSESKLEQLREQVNTIVVPSEILKHSSAIDKLYKGLTSYEKSVKDKTGQETSRRQMRNDARRILKEINPNLDLEKAESLRKLLTMRSSIRSLASDYQDLENDVRKNRADIEDNRAEIERIKEDLELLGEAKVTDELRATASSARKAGDLDSMLVESTRSFTTEEERCQKELRRLGIWQGSLEELSGLALPSLETCELFEERFRKIEDENHDREKRRKEIRREQAKRKKEIETLRKAGSVPSEEDLKEARSRRERGWTLIKRRWLAGEDVDSIAREFDQERELHEAYEETVAEADDVADRLYREAERVSKHAALEADYEHLQRELDDLAANEKIHEKEMETLDAEWSQIWSGLSIEPSSPREMRAWLRKASGLQVGTSQLMELKPKLDDLSQRLESFRERLFAELSSLGMEFDSDEPGLEPVLSRCEDLIEQCGKNAKEKRSLEDALRRAENKFTKLEEAQKVEKRQRKEWQSKWDKAVSVIGTGSDVSPENVQDLMDRIHDLFDKVDQAQEQKQRVYGIDMDIKEYQGEVHDFAGRIGMDVEEVPPDQLVLRLKQDLKDAEKKKSDLENLNKQIRETEAGISELKLTIQAAEERMGNLKELACAEKGADLESASLSSTQLCKLKEKLEDTERSIVRAGDGANLEKLESEAGEADFDALPGRIDQLKTERTELEKIGGELRELLGSLRTQADSLDGGGMAAEASERAQQVIASIKNNLATYLRTRVAQLIMQHQIERFREENQAPILKRAGEFFKKITLGSYQSLRAGLDEKNNPVLTGINSEGNEVEVAGMSTGTRDQLYLALRIAALEEHLERSGPMPFIVDDILINFDDDRSKATLKVLAVLAEKTQVLLFTHHGKVVELAESIEAPAGIFVTNVENGV